MKNTFLGPGMTAKYYVSFMGSTTSEIPIQWRPQAMVFKTQKTTLEVESRKTTIF